LVAAIVGTWSHGRHALVHHRLAWTGGPAMAAGALLGALASARVSGRMLLVTFALMATAALPLMLLSPSPAAPAAERDAVRFSRPAAVSGFVGKVATGQVPLWPAAIVVLGSLGGAPLGGRVSRRVPVGVLRGVLA